MNTEELFALAKDKEHKLRAVIEVEDKVINPYSTIKVVFYDENRLIGDVETIFKCDVLSDGCFFCFTSDFSSVVLTRNRERLVLPTTWQGVYLWHNSPVFEDQFYTQILLRKDHLIAKRDTLLKIRNFKTCLVERQGELLRLVVDEDLNNPIFTTCLSQEF